MPTYTEPPALDIAQRHATDKPGRLGGEHVLECRIVWQLLQHLHASGFNVVAIFDGESNRRCRTHKEAMELLFALDGAWLHVRLEGERRGHNIAVVPGRGRGVIGEYWVAPGDPDGFAACTAEFHVLRHPGLQ